MKAILALAVAAAALGFAAPSSASAYDHCHPGARRVVGYQSCGTPIYAVYQVCGYDGYGRPIGRWVTETPRYCPPPAPTYCPPPSCPPSGYGHGHVRGGPPLPPIPPHHRAAFSFFFGR